MVWGSSTLVVAHLEMHHQCWKVYTCFRATYAPIQVIASQSLGAGLACLQSIPFTRQNAPAHRENYNTSVELLESYISNNFSLPNFQRFPDAYRRLLKEEGVLCRGKHTPVLTFLRRIAAIKFTVTMK